MLDLRGEIGKFKNYIGLKHDNNNNNNYVYLRLSGLDNTIKVKENQIQDALNKLQADLNKLISLYPNLEKEGFKLFVEVKSAYKNSVREEFIKLYTNYLFKDLKINDLLEDLPINKEKNLYISSFDRLSRVFFYSLTFQLLRKLNNINIFSLIPQENYLELENKNVRAEDNNKQLLYVFQLMMLSSSASKHSEDMSIKIKKRVSKNNEGQTISNKSGKRWGGKQYISNTMRAKIKDRYKRFTAQVISEQPDIYQEKEGKRERISVHTIRKVVQD